MSGRRTIGLAFSCLVLAACLPILAIAGSVAPLADPQQVGWVHAPYEVGECDLCHERADPASPGPVPQPINDLCYGCHEQMREMMTEWSYVHAAAEDECTACHNPHNGVRRRMLLAEPPALCAQCHEDILELAEHSTVQHGAVLEGDACLNCHNPHAAHVEKLLIDLPFDLCVGCHGQSELRDDRGKRLADLQQLLVENPVHHGPVADKDCTACHLVHGGEAFRLLVQEYPAKFYAPYERQNYGLCFECHNEEAFNQAQTTTLTGFRDGSRNLHYLHVNKADRGRTCRACHDVHAAPQAHLIRDGVPYGSSGWILKLNYEALPNGGACAKTCHSKKIYDRSLH